MTIDSHCHLHDARFAQDRSQVLERARQGGLKAFITVGCDVPTTTEAQALAHQYDDVFFTAGFHPHEAEKADKEQRQMLQAFVTDQKCVAIGECGLDYYYEHSSKEIQREVFAWQLGLAHSAHLPVVIHLRDALADCLAILKMASLPKKSLLIHCFSGTWAEAEELLAVGCSLSLSGIVTFKGATSLVEVAKNVPLDRLLIETDAPYLAPVPFRGKRNEPLFLVETLKKIAEARGETEETIKKAVEHNTRVFFGI